MDEITQTISIPIDIDNRVSIVISTFLAFIFLQSVIKSSIPQNRDPPAIGNLLLYPISSRILNS